MLPRLGSSKLVTRWIVVTLVASIFAALDGGWLARWAALEPSRVWHGELWRLVTWPLIETGPVSLILTCAAIFRLGGDLAWPWGDRRLARFVVEIVVAASVVTCLIAAITGGGHLHRLGGWAVTDILLIAWARQFPDRPLVIYHFLVLRGRALVAVTLGAAVLLAVYFGPVFSGPELVGCAAAAAYPRTLLRR